MDGKPLPNQLVYADYIKSAQSHTHGDQSHEHDGEIHSHGHDVPAEDAHTHTNGQQHRTNAQGLVTVILAEDGSYYLRTIYMVSVTDSDELTHQSKWATLTFEVSHKHDSTTHTHDEHEHEDGIPSWIFIGGSLIIIGLLFLFFREKNS